MALIAWPDIVWIAAIAFAVGGGAVSMYAYAINRQANRRDGTSKRSHRLYLVSYVLMSVSILMMAIRGMLG